MKSNDKNFAIYGMCSRQLYLHLALGQLPALVLQFNNQVKRTALTCGRLVVFRWLYAVTTQLHPDGWVTMSVIEHEKSDDGVSMVH